MQKKYVPLVVFLVALLVFAAHMGARAVLAEPAFTYAQEKRIYLTFDDGPSTVVTGRVLDILKREKPDLLGVAFDPQGGSFPRENKPE